MVAAHRALMLRSLRYDKSETFETGRDLPDVVAWLEHTKVVSLAPGTGTMQVWSIQTTYCSLVSTGSTISCGCPRQDIRREECCMAGNI